MKKSKSSVKKLTLKHQTLRQLAAIDLQYANGGGTVISDAGEASCGGPDPGRTCKAN